MSPAKVLQTGPLTSRFNDQLAARHPVTRLWEQPDPAAFLREQGAEFELLATSVRFGCSAALMAQMPRLRAICSFGVGYDSIDVAAARARGIAVSNTPDVLNDCVADLAMGLVIDCARRLSAADRFVRAGHWPQGSFALGRQVTGKRLGIVGLGRIGKEVAKRAGGFSMPIRYHNRRPDPGSPHTHEPDLKALATWADFLVLTCPGGAATHHLINAEILQALGAKGTLINVSRGSVVDEGALVAALRNGTLGGAGLDVFEHEPQVPAALLALDNVVLLPHVGSGTEETRANMERLVLDNLQAFLDQGRLLTPV